MTTLPRRLPTPRTDYDDAPRTDFFAQMQNAVFWLAAAEATARENPGSSLPPQWRQRIRQVLAELIASFAMREKLSIEQATREIDGEYIGGSLRHYAVGGKLLPRMGTL